MKAVIRQKISDFLAAPLPELTRRDIRLPSIKNKVFAVIGMRRSGKTSFLFQCLSDRIRAGFQRNSQLYFNFEDERLCEMKSQDLQFVLEGYYELQPGLRDKNKVTFYFDEIQLVRGWETFVRRIIDTEKVDVFISGSSAKLLSREIATGMRGRAIEVPVHPFSFKEALRHSGHEPDCSWGEMPKSVRSDLQNCLNSYLVAGGFPEAQGVSGADRGTLLRTYVDVAVLRDVIERNGVSNPLALRWLQRHLLSSPASLFSVHKFSDALKSQGIPVAKDTLHEYLSYLEDTFLLYCISVYSGSERRRMVNPRKAYPADPGLIPIYDSTGRSNIGHALETVVFIELKRRGCHVCYVKTQSGYEVDFLVKTPEGAEVLIQVCSDISGELTYSREIRAMKEAMAEYPSVKSAILLTLDAIPPRTEFPAGIQWKSSIEWLLEE
jgi:predicted AAA+ superfamily ATPase